MARRGYRPEFRRPDLEIIEAGRKVAEVSDELAVSQQTIYGAAGSSGPGGADVTVLDSKECGLGFELVFVIPLLMALRRRTRTA